MGCQARASCWGYVCGRRAPGNGGGRGAGYVQGQRRQHTSGRERRNPGGSTLALEGESVAT